jgi:acetaldehyde dehydrogenase (acetylating)
LVGRTAVDIAAAIGVTVPPGTRALVAELQGVGRDHPLSIEKLCPVLSYYVVEDWRAGCERCKDILRYGGMGHTMSVHAEDDDVVLQFGLHKPAFRIVVNTPTTHGSIGLTTGLDPAMTLGCGGFGGNITSDNISPRHLINIKRVAYELRPASGGRAAPAVSSAPTASAARPAAPRRGSPLDAGTLATRIEGFLAARGIHQDTALVVRAERPGASGGRGDADVAAAGAETPATASAASRSMAHAPAEPEPVAFVCEDDVRQAIRAGRRIRLAPRAIVTPSARDLGEAHRLFEDAEPRTP